MNTDDISTDTLNADYDQLEQIVSMLRTSGGLGEPHLSADRVVIETQNTKLEFTAEGDSIEIREVE